MTAGVATEPGFDIARVLHSTVSVIRTRWRSFVPLALLLVGLPELVFTAARIGLHEMGAFGGAGSISFAGALVTFAGHVLLQAALFAGTAAATAGRTATPVELLAEARPVFWPLAGANLLMGLGIALGLILLVVPGVLLALAWYVTAPVVALERSRVLDAFRRSAAMTRNHRWNLFWATVVLCLVLLLTVALLSALTAGLFWIFGRGPATGMAEAVSAVVTSVVASVWAACVYLELRSLEAAPAAD